MLNAISLAWLIPVLPFLAFAIIGICFNKKPKIAATISIGAISIGCLLSLMIAFQVFSSSEIITVEYAARWLDLTGLTINMGILIDPLAAVMLIVVTVVALLVQIYSIGYMHGDESFSRYYAFQSVFAGSMLGLVLSNNFGQIFVFWELVGLSSYLLIGFWFGRNSAKEAAKKAFITNRIGDFGFLLGILFLQVLFGTVNFLDLPDLVAGFDNQALLIGLSILLFLGPVGKSAQFPLHVWLPDAMEGPTPVSALIHAATMVAAGVYLIARAYFIFAQNPSVLFVIAVVGAFTSIFAASIALTQFDIKRILAYSTLSQLGYMVMAMGLGAMTAGMFHLMTHAFFKSLLFLAAGSVIHAMGGEQDIRKMGGLGKKIKVTTVCFIIGSLALAGIPPLAGFWSKDEILLGAFAGGYTMFYLVGTIVAFMTAFYMFRLIFIVFFGKKEAPASAHESPKVMTVPLIVLAVFSCLVGFVGSPLMNNVFGHYITWTGAVHHNPSISVMLISTVVALAGIALAYAIYQKNVLDPKIVAKKCGWFYKLLYNKYYIDEIYAVIIRIFVDGLAKVLAWIDIHIVNGFINMLAVVTGGIGSALRYTESGQVQSYALYMLLGAGVLLIVAVAVACAALA